MQKLKYNSIKAAQNVQYNFTKIVHTTKPCKAEEIFRSHILGGGGGLEGEGQTTIISKVKPS
jgi:hypothetical protein